MRALQKLSQPHIYGPGSASCPVQVASWTTRAPKFPQLTSPSALRPANDNFPAKKPVEAATSAEARTNQEVQDHDDGKAGDAEQWDVKLLYDGDCPVCMAEVKLLESRDKGRGKIKFVNISTDDYDPDENAGVTFEEAMGSIHAILRDGKVISGIDVFRQVYAVVGLGWIFAFTSFPLFGGLARCAYGMWAKSRLNLTGRHNLATILQEKKGCNEECDAHWDP